MAQVVQNKTAPHKKIQSFTDLDAWKAGHNLVITVYEIAKKFPKCEEFELAKQLKRAVTSITSNIAEGFSRQSYKEKMYFYRIALGSLTEVQNQLLIGRDVQLITQDIFYRATNQAVTASKIINGLIKSTGMRRMQVPNS